MSGTTRHPQDRRQGGPSPAHPDAYRPLGRKLNALRKLADADEPGWVDGSLLYCGDGGGPARRQQRWRRAVPLLARPEVTEDTHDDFATLVAVLSPRQATAVFPRYYLDLSETEIAATMGCRPGTVKSTLSAALHRLEEVLR